MSRPKPTLTDQERHFGKDEIIVSKTDTKGRITYVNDVFIRISGFSEEEVLGQPHSMIRHADMPRAVFKLLWDYILGGKEVFAYVKNLCKNGDHYWVYAHVTPTVSEQGEILGFHSNRRTPDRSAIETIKTVYAKLLEEERRHMDPRKGLEMSYALLEGVLAQTKKPYEEFIWSVA